MNKVSVYFNGVVLCLAMITNCAGQTAQQEPKPVTDGSMSQLLEADLQFRNAEIGSPEIMWWDNGYGYYGTYSHGGEYMVRYDSHGSYLETLMKKNWNDEDVMTFVKSAYRQSAYNSLQILTYWEAVDIGRRGCYMELQDDRNKIFKVWIDDKGKFSNMPLDTGINK